MLGRSKGNEANYDRDASSVQQIPRSAVASPATPENWPGPAGQGNSPSRPSAVHEAPAFGRALAGMCVPAQRIEHGQTRAVLIGQHLAGGIGQNALRLGRAYRLRAAHRHRFRVRLVGVVSDHPIGGFRRLDALGQRG